MLLPLSGFKLLFSTQDLFHTLVVVSQQQNSVGGMWVVLCRLSLSRMWNFQLADRFPPSCVSLLHSKSLHPVLNIILECYSFPSCSFFPSPFPKSKSVKVLFPRVMCPLYAPVSIMIFSHSFCGLSVVDQTLSYEACSVPVAKTPCFKGIHYFHVILFQGPCF